MEILTKIFSSKFFNWSFFFDGEVNKSSKLVKQFQFQKYHSLSRGKISLNETKEIENCFTIFEINLLPTLR